MRFSIITTVRNGDSYLLQYFRSLAKMPDPSIIEVVLVDDNSSESNELRGTVAKLKDIGFLVQYLHSGGRGRACALNLGLALSSSRYCFIQDIDDVSFSCRFTKFLEDLKAGETGVLTLYSGYYGYFDEGRIRVRKVPKVHNVDIAVRRGMPFPHTFMVIDKLGLGDIRYEAVFAGLDYRLLCDAYASQLPIVLSNKRVGIHFKYPESNYSSKSKVLSQLSFLKTQIRLFTFEPSAAGLIFLVARIVRLPFFYIFDLRKRNYR